jgi:hypothetical protein
VAGDNVGKSVHRIGDGQEELSGGQGERLLVVAEIVPERGLLPVVLIAACDLMSCNFFLIRFEVVARGPLGPGFMRVFAKEQLNCALTHGTQGHSPEQRILRSEHSSLHSWSVAFLQ